MPCKHRKGASEHPYGLSDAKPGSQSARPAAVCRKNGNAERTKGYSEFLGNIDNNDPKTRVSGKTTRVNCQICRCIDAEPVITTNPDPDNRRAP